MLSLPLKAFVHPHQVYRLEYPAYWDQITQKDGASCGFGPHERDDVGLWISILPVSADTDKLAEALPKLMRQGMQEAQAENIRVDPTLRHYGLIADMTREGEGGHYWIVAGGDVVLFASTQVPAGERGTWNPLFHAVMASLQITRDQQLQDVKLAGEVLGLLQERHPDQEFTMEDGKIRGRNQVVYLGNLAREIQGAPTRRAQIIQRFVDSLSHPDMADVGQEEWPAIQGMVFPMLKPRDYIRTEGPTQHLLTTEWLADVLICYVIKSKKIFRFVTGWDVNRWEIDHQTLHQQALTNLTALAWPRELLGARGRKDEGRVIIVDTDDNLASSRLLHPGLHQLFSTALGSTFWAGIPCRDRLVLFSDRRALKQRIGRRLAKDHDTSAYRITPKPFLVTRDGIAPAVDR